MNGKLCNGFYILWRLLLVLSKNYLMMNLSPDLSNQNRNVNSLINRFSNLPCLHCHSRLPTQLQILHFFATGLHNVSNALSSHFDRFLLHFNFGYLFRQPICQSGRSGLTPCFCRIVNKPPNFWKPLPSNVVSPFL